jgi:hypothetical protein
LKIFGTRSTGGPTQTVSSTSQRWQTVFALLNLEKGGAGVPDWEEQLVVLV